MDDFDIIGHITVDDSGRATIQGLSGDIDNVGSRTDALGTISSFVWGGIILKGIDAVIGAIGNAISAFGEFMSSSIDSARESQDALANLNATIASTGGQAGVTSEAAQALATSLESVTKFSDETIINGEAMLLTFTQIGSDIFPMATEAMLNLAQKFGSVDAASIQLGKALNDPITGVTALRRVGVMLTDQQEESIKKFMEQGDIMSAQKVILGELETEFGGLAQAMGETASGQAAIAMNKLDNFKELLGGPLLVATQSFKLGLLDMVMGSPAFQLLVEFLTSVNSLLQSGAPLLEAFGVAMMQFGAINPIFDAIGKALVDMQVAFDNGASVFEGVAVFLGDIAAADPGPLGMVAEFLGNMLGILKNLGVEAQPAIDSLWQSMQKIAADVAPVLLEVFGAIQDAIVKLAAEAVPWLVEQFNKIAAWYKENGPYVTATIKEWAQFFINDVIPAVIWLTELLFKIVGVFIDIGLAWSEFTFKFQALDLTGMAKKLGEDFVNTITNWWTVLVSSSQAMSANIQTTISDWITYTQTVIVDWVQNTKASILGWIADTITSISNWATSVNDAIVSAIAGVIDNIFANLGIDKTAFLAQWQSIIDDVILIVQTLQQRVADYLAAVVLTVVNKFEEIKTTITSLVQAVVIVFTSMFSSASEQVSSDVSSIQQTFADVFNRIASAIGAYMAPIVGAILIGLSTIYDFFSYWWMKIENYLVSVWDNIRKTVYDKVSTVANVISDGIEYALMKVETTAAQYYYIGKEIINGIITGIQTYAGSLITAATNAIQNFLDRVKAFLGISSPSTVFMDIAKAMIDGLIAGWKDAFGGFYDLVVDAINQVLKLPGFKQVAEFLGIGPIETADTTSTYVPPVGTTTGTTTSGGTTAPAQNIVNYNFYADVYVGNIGDLQYECGPNTVVQSTAPLLVNSPR